MRDVLIRRALSKYLRAYRPQTEAVVEKKNCFQTCHDGCVQHNAQSVDTSDCADTCGSAECFKPAPKA